MWLWKWGLSVGRLDCWVTRWETSTGRNLSISVCNSLFFETVQILPEDFPELPAGGGGDGVKGDEHVQLLVLCMTRGRARASSVHTQMARSLALALPFSMAVLLTSRASPRSHKRCFCLILLCKHFNLCLSVPCYIIHHFSTNFSSSKICSHLQSTLVPFPFLFAWDQWTTLK